MREWQKIAHWLRNNPRVAKVYWPGFEDSAGYAIAKKQMRDFGGMISFELKNDAEAEVKGFYHQHIFFHWPKVLVV